MSALLPHRIDPVRILQAETPLRVWSLIVTIFGDAVMNRGTIPDPAPIWIAELMELLELLDIEAGIARTNLSRLVASGTLVRDKSGRNTFYRLSAVSAADFADAARQIYAHTPEKPADAFHLAAIDLCSNRAGARKALEEVGFRFFGASAALLPARTDGSPPAMPEGAILASSEPSEMLCRVARDLWQIDALDAGYRRFCAEFKPLAGAAAPSPAEAVVLRIAMVHVFRRLALRDPGLPPVILSNGWAGEEARALFATLSARLNTPSEDWLSTHGFRR